MVTQVYIYIWLVVYLPLWKIWKSVGTMYSIYLVFLMAVCWIWFFMYISIEAGCRCWRWSEQHYWYINQAAVVPILFQCWYQRFSTLYLHACLIYVFIYIYIIYIYAIICKYNIITCVYIHVFKYIYIYTWWHDVNLQYGRGLLNGGICVGPS